MMSPPAKPLLSHPAQVDVRSDKPRPEMLLHWAYEGWKLPPNSVLPPGTAPAGDMAVQSPFRLGQSALLTIPEVRVFNLRPRP